jgi:Leucine-rich repeat (LRR) protein
MKTKLLLLLLFLTIIINAQTNLVPNGNFENWTSSSQPDNWYRYFNGFVSKSTSAQNGTTSTNMKIASGTLNYINSEYFPVVANKTYRVTLYHKLVSGNFSAIDLSLYHKPSTFKEEIIKKTDATVSSTEWRKIEFDYTPTVTENIEVDIWTTGTLNSEILVDNVSVIDVATIGAQYTLIPDENFEKKLIALGIDSGATDGKVLTANVTKITDLTLDTTVISDLTGIQSFTGLKSLTCEGKTLSNGSGSIGKLTFLDVSQNVNLVELDCSANQLTSLNVSKNTTLTRLECNNNQLSNLDVTSNIALSWVQCSYNKLVGLDLSKSSSLSTLGCDYNQLKSLDFSSCRGLYRLYCNYNSLTNLNINQCLSVKEIHCDNNQLTVLDVSNNIILSRLTCGNNQIETLDISNNLYLDDIGCSSNKLKKLDVSKHPLLYSLYCSNNQLTSLLLGNALMASLSCGSNQLTSIDISKNISLEEFYCSNNLIANLDISKSPRLQSFSCSNNRLVSLDLRNGNTPRSDSQLNLKNNPSLTCILVDNVAAANSYLTSAKDPSASFSTDCTPYTLIPDPNFEDKLIALGIDKDGKNGKVVTADISSLTYLDIQGCLIKDLTGIQGFTALTTLNCSGNLVKKIDLSKNTAIATLNCANNPTLICIQVANVAAAANWATTKDATASFSLDCTVYTLIPDAKFEDKLIALGIDKDGKNGKVATESIATLISLNVSNSSIVDLTGIQNFVALTKLDCSKNQLTTLDVSKNVALTSLSCYYNQLTTLDVSKNVALTNLHCYENKLTSLDVSKNVALTFFYCNSNKLSNLNLKNGKNTLLTNSNINLSSNPDLKCITVDDVTYSNTNWADRKDATATYSSTCSNLGIEKSVFDKIAIYPNPTKGELHIDNIVLEKATVYDALGKLVKTATFTSGANDNIIHLTGLSKGIYYVYLESEGANTAKKIVVE